MPAGSKWLEISVTAAGETAEAVAELFDRLGWGGAVVEMPVDCFEYELPAAPPSPSLLIKTYLPCDNGLEEARRRLEEGLLHLGQAHPISQPIIRELAEEDWTEGWKQQYHRLRVGRRIVIVPVWEEYKPEPGETVILLEPGMAFGTGLHPTTRLCLEALESRLAPGGTVLDVGTGSGVLSIAAAKLGAGPVMALDADPVAVRTARENTALNGVADQVAVRHGSLPGDVPEGWIQLYPDLGGDLYLLEAGCFDMVLVNILAPVIIGMAPALAARLRTAGFLITAGLIEKQEQAVLDALQAEGLHVIARTQEDDWLCLVARKG